MDRKFEPFYDLYGQPTTSMGVPYNELFSTEEVRRLTFTRFLAKKNQELSPLTEKNKTSAQSYPVDNFFMTTNILMSIWLLLGLELFYYQSLTIAALMIDYSRLPPLGHWF